MGKYFLYIVCGLLLSLQIQGLAQRGNRDYQYALIEAVKQKNLGNIPGAIELYKMVLEENDSVAIAYYELGTLFLIVNQPDLAEMNFRKAYYLDGSNKWYANGYLDVLVIQERFDEAEEMVRDIIATTENKIEYSFKQANIYFLAGKSRKALKCLNRIEKKKGVSDKIILLKANIYEKEGKFSSARKEIEKLIKYFPESLQFFVVAAELAMKEENQDLAKKYYLGVLELDSTNIYALTNLTDYFRIKKDHKKSLYYLKISFKSPYIEYERKMTILSYYLTDPYFIENYPDQLEELIDVILLKHEDKEEIKLFAVDFFIQRRNYERAYRSLKPILDSGQKDYDLWRQGILLANVLEKNDELLKLSTEASLIFPDSSEVVYFKGIAEYENDMFEEVIETFNSSLFRLNSNMELAAKTKQILAEAYHRIKSYEKSDSLFREIIRDEPDNYLVMNNYSYYLALRGEMLDEAKILSYKTIIENPENGTFLDTYAWVLFRLGEYKEAERYINIALLKGGLNDPDVNEHAGEIHEYLESYRIARSFYEKAIILGGEKERLKEKIKKLDIHCEK